MSSWMSFYIHDTGKIALGNLRSHVRIAQLESIKDTAWYEAEWTTENYDGLKVDAIDANRLIDGICKKWKNRSEFFKWAAPQLVELDCCHRKITELPELPKCKRLMCYYSNLTELPELPECEELHCYNNNLTKLPELPKCKVLFCSNNKLTELPELPECKELYCPHNKITELPELPKCEKLYCLNNPLKEK